MKSTCPNCNYENPTDAKFCLECGFRLKRSSDPLIGQQIGNHRLLERIGVGGMGVIYKAEHINLSKTYAVKFLHPQFASDEEVVERFRREAQVISSLDHPNIVRETDFGWLDGVGFYLVMEFLEGETLKEVIKREGALEPERVLRIFEQLLDALEVAHDEGVVHRDLKPENLYLIERRGKEVLKILDFGIARIAMEGEKKQEFTMDGEVYGSPTYMSPEQARGDISRVDARSDLYSAGIILVEALTGRPPYQGNTPAEVMLSHISSLAPRISDLRPDLLYAPELEDVIIKSLGKESEDRYTDATAFLHALLPTLEKTIALRKKAQDTPPSGSPGVAQEQTTGKMEGHRSPEWFHSGAAPSTPKASPGHSYDSLPSMPAPVHSPTPETPQQPGSTGHSWPFPSAQPVPVPQTSTPARSQLPPVNGDVSVQSQTSSTPTPSVSSSVSLAGQPSPYIETTPQPHSVAASQLSQAPASHSLTPSRGVPPNPVSLSPSHSNLTPATLQDNAGWDPTAPQSDDYTDPGYDPASQTSSMRGLSDPDKVEANAKRKRMLVMAAAVFGGVLLLMGLLKLVGSGGSDNNGNSPGMQTDAGLPPLPQMRNPVRSLPVMRRKVVGRTPPARRAKKPPSRRRDNVVEYKPPPVPRSIKDTDTDDPPQPRKALKTYRLTILSKPSTADIFISGQGKVATTPYVLQLPQGSRVMLVIRKIGFLPQTISWRAEEHSRVMLKLIPDPSQ
ncbi:MAG: hypothetical protein EP343_31405 [Deltaproteobacteria bacterium]|nr:MAG: hypothetical protein EP343_31405 [Deltaproteobacteria bacterium]